jgi:hypothetical protein
MAYIELLDRSPIEGSEALSDEKDLAQENARNENQDLSQEASDVDDAETVTNGDK